MPINWNTELIQHDHPLHEYVARVFSGGRALPTLPEAVFVAIVEAFVAGQRAPVEQLEARVVKDTEFPAEGEPIAHYEVHVGSGVIVERYDSEDEANRHADAINQERRCGACEIFDLLGRQSVPFLEADSQGAPPESQGAPPAPKRVRVRKAKARA